jgi:hypothetical protein
MIALATKRTRFYQSVGALGVIELTAPGRCVKVVKGLKRIGVPSDDYHYYSLHATLDRQHWANWNENVMKPLVLEYPDSKQGLAEGALLRLHAGQQCFDAYSKHLALDLDFKADSAFAFSPGLTESPDDAYPVENAADRPSSEKMQIAEPS